MQRELDPVADYMVRGGLLNKLAALGAKLDGPSSLSWDDRRDGANLINLLLSEAQEQSNG